MLKHLRKKQKRGEDFKGLIKKIDLLNQSMNMVMPKRFKTIIFKDYLSAIKKLAREYSGEYSKLGEEEILKITRPYLLQKNEDINSAEDSSLDYAI